MTHGHHADTSLPPSRLGALSRRTPLRTAAADFGKGGALTAVHFWAAFALLFLVAALPILRAELPPLFDYPNHLARMDLLARLAGSQALQRYYELHWRVIPDLGMDLVMLKQVRGPDPP